MTLVKQVSIDLLYSDNKKTIKSTELTSTISVILFFHTRLLQGDDHRPGSEGVPGGAVVRRVEVRLHDVVDGEGGEDGPALGRRFALLHSVPLHQGALLLLPHVLLPRPDLKHAV